MTSHVPTFIGRGLESQMEIHCFLKDLNPNEETIQKYYQTVADWNNQSSGLPTMKACLLCLVFRDAGPIVVMQSARYFRSDSHDKVLQESAADAAFFEKAGFPVIRSKVEANAHSMDGIPETDTDAQKYPDLYFEIHIKVVKAGVTVITDAEIAELLKVSAEMTEYLGTPIPLSWNINKDQFPEDGAGNQRFLNVRFCGIGLIEVKRRLAAITTRINETTSFKVSKTIDEYVWHDTYRAMDKGWIDF